MLRNLSLLAVAFCSPFVLASALPAQTPRLQLTAEILGQSYCSTNNDATLRLKTRLRYTNLGSQPLIVYKGHDLFYQTKLRSLGGTPYEVHLLNMHYFDEEFERIDARAPGKVFVTLAPNASFQRELIVGVGVADESKERTNTSVKPGEHRLQLIVSTWYQSPKLAEQLRQQWQRKGFLWSQPLTSVPVNVSIAKPHAVLPCR